MILQKRCCVFSNNKDNSNSRFLIVWFGQLISSIGSGLTAFALGIYAFGKSGSATSYSLVVFCAFMPALLLKPIGGTLSDRIDRKTLMIIGDLGSALGLVFIICMMLMGITDLWMIYLGTVISSVFVALQNPAYKATVTDLVTKEFYTKASGLMQLAESSKYLIAPIIAGVLLKIIDIKLLLIIDAITFLIAITTVFSLKVNFLKKNMHSSEQSFITDFIGGFVYIMKNKGVLGLIGILSVVTFFIGFYQALLGPMILAFADSQTLGVSQTIATTGMLISSFFIGLLAKSNKKIPILSIGLVFCGIFFSFIGISANIINITLFGFLFFLTLPFVNTSLDVLIRSNVTNSMQGRVWSIVSLISQLGMAIALGVAGYLADNIFDPLLQPKGALVSTIGSLIGTGEGRGIGLMFVISGIFVSITAIIISQLKTLTELDNSISYAE